jgi:hypothetical protein
VLHDVRDRRREGGHVGDRRPARRATVLLGLMETCLAQAGAGLAGDDPG